MVSLQSAGKPPRHRAPGVRPKWYRSTKAKGSASDPANFRPISLTLVFRKILEQCLMPLLLHSMPVLDIAQGGFRAHRGTLDQALCLQELMKVYTVTPVHGTEQVPPVVAFLDIKAAYDSCNRLVIWDTLCHYVPEPLLKLLQSLFDDIVVKVIHQNVTSRELHPRHGVLQGSILSPFLYSIFIDTLPCLLCSVSSHPHLVRVPTPPPSRSLNFSSRRPFTFNTHHASPRSLIDELRDSYNPWLSSDVDASTRLPFSYVPVNCLMYADDVAIIGSSGDVQRMLTAAEQHSNLLGYRWSPTKCEILNASSSETVYMLYGEPIPHCSTFRYLGIPFSANGLDQSLLINQSRTKAVAAMQSLRASGVHMYGFGLTSALRAYKIFVHPIIEYGIAISFLTALQTTELDEIQRQCLRMCICRPANQKAIGTLTLSSLSALPDLRTRYHTLQTKFALRARTLPTTTLVVCILPQLQKPMSEVRWPALRYNVLWKSVQLLMRRPNPPRCPLSEAIRAQMQSQIDKLVSHATKYITIKRGLRQPVWDPTLLLPCTRKERHRLVKWRLAWLPPTPSILCQCALASANRDHLSSCTLISADLRSFRWSLSALTPDPPTGCDAIDIALNLLPRKVPRRLGKWRTLWPALLSLLRRIDEITSDSPFDDEPPPGSMLLEASNSLSPPPP